MVTNEAQWSSLKLFSTNSQTIDSVQVWPSEHEREAPCSHSWHTTLQCTKYTVNASFSQTQTRFEKKHYSWCLSVALILNIYCFVELYNFGTNPYENTSMGCLQVYFVCYWGLAIIMHSSLTLYLILFNWVWHVGALTGNWHLSCLVREGCTSSSCLMRMLPAGCVCCS